AFSKTLAKSLGFMGSLQGLVIFWVLFY
ncbi:MAG: hypothetical protein ACI945_000828, partial [Pseudohongiellaceae bacterium]